MSDLNNQLNTALVGWVPDQIGTLVFLMHGDEVLLIDKKTGYGAGRTNGPGGKLEPGETPRQCAERELHEEVCMRAQALTLTATIRFVELDGPQWFGYVFCGHTFDGTPTETVEARPRWHPINALPIDNMWPDDAFWLPRVLAGEFLHADFLFRKQELLTGRMQPLAATDLAPLADQPPQWRRD